MRVAYELVPIPRVGMVKSLEREVCDLGLWSCPRPGDCIAVLAIGDSGISVLVIQSEQNSWMLRGVRGCWQAKFESSGSRVSSPRRSVRRVAGCAAEWTEPRFDAGRRLFSDAVGLMRAQT